MHLKDAPRANGKAEAVAFGAGDVDYEGQLGRSARRIRALDVRGNPLPVGRALSEAQMKRPAGSLHRRRRGGDGGFSHSFGRKTPEMGFIEEGNEK
jgi:hypothetical protein